MDRSHRGVDAPRLTTPARAALTLAALGVATATWAQAPPALSPPEGRPVHVVLVGDSTVTEGSGWGLGFRQLVAPGVRVTNTAQNGRSSKSFRDEGHWATALAAKGDVYVIQFGHNDQPGKGPERETDPATTFLANMARYVDEVRAIGATPILVTSLVRRTFSERRPPALVSTLGPWVEAVRRVSIEKRVPLVDLDASSRAFCERLGPVQTAGFNLKKDDGTWDTTHLDARGSAAFARLVVEDLRGLVPSLAPYLSADDTPPALAEPDDMPAPHPLLGWPRRPDGQNAPFGRVYTRAIRLARIRHRAVSNGRTVDPAALPPMVTSPAILVAWELLPEVPPDGRVDCGFAPGAPRQIGIRRLEDAPLQPELRPELQPLGVYSDAPRIRELLEPFDADIARVRWVAVLDPARLVPDTLLAWRTRQPCPLPAGPSLAAETGVRITADDIALWTGRSPAPPP